MRDMSGYKGMAHKYGASWQFRYFQLVLDMLPASTVVASLLHLSRGFVDRLALFVFLLEGPLHVEVELSFLL